MRLGLKREMGKIEIEGRRDGGGGAHVSSRTAFASLDLQWISRISVTETETREGRAGGRLKALSKNNFHGRN